MQHKAVCKVLLTVLCGRPFNCFRSMSTTPFAWASHIIFYFCNCLPWNLQHSPLSDCSEERRFKTHHVLQLQEVGDFEAPSYLPPQNLIRSTKLNLTTEPPISCRCCYRLPFCPLYSKFKILLLHVAQKFFRYWSAITIILCYKCHFTRSLNEAFFGITSCECHFLLSFICYCLNSETLYSTSFKLNFP